jgi:predicted enzyme related to lactoylglutathione lyase
MAPTLVNGKICYLELPALNVGQSAAFYSNVFGWSMRTRGDGAQAFDDTTGEVSGAFVLGRNTWDTPGLLFYVMVDSVAAACQAVEAHGGTIVQPIGADAPEITARFRDPAGNIIGLYQEAPRTAQA